MSARTLSTSIPCTAQASSRVSPADEGHPTQCIPDCIRITPMPLSRTSMSPISISFVTSGLIIFGSTLKFGMAVDTCDVSLCSPVSKEQLHKIKTYFEDHPKDRVKFESAVLTVTPSITTVNLKIDEKQQKYLSDAIDKLLPTITLPKLRVLLAEHGLSEVLPGGDNTYLYLYGYPWDLDENFDFQYFKYEFTRK